ncbi:hypothetical protein [Elizabethkingia anophelis]|uniref:Uncharacterized protein n=1 Tax=Elizabethkingia anophelis TaxID=1117645 RepID=A0A7Z7LUG7_9FLAO|nr:hypothetical protein [Elizabethkingia anophelis]MCT3631913.1 hypothetical protein [Elizabethkingia anophelis]MCT3635427.1 hypothetical protein [Elizabethkingia anophelis]MCT3754584.1 hypothetical protein [Elizabethkingia anophelis]MCT3776209.1 hypothetical protein [Elizabethkingia anophelis]MCT3783322.1 hypothetical protein [Elizabethkingia anophelis]
MSKRKSKTGDIPDNLGNNSKKTDLERAKIVLEKAKALKTPIKHLTSSDSAFGRSLEEKKKDNDE